MNDTVASILSGVIVGTGIVVLLFLFVPLLMAVGGYITGWVLATIFPFAGNWIVSGASALGLEISLADLPTIGAFLGFVGAFFKAYRNNKNA